MLLNILYTLNSFKIIPHVFIIYLKYCHVNTLKTYNIDTKIENKKRKTKHWLHLWFLQCKCTLESNVLKVQKTNIKDPLNIPYKINILWNKKKVTNTMLITKLVPTSHLVINFFTFESYKTFPKIYTNKMWMIDMNNVSSFSSKSLIHANTR